MPPAETTRKSSRFVRGLPGGGLWTAMSNNSNNNKTGDSNGTGSVDAADYVVWR